MSCSCCCDTAISGSTGCCGIHGFVPSGTGIRIYSESASGATSGVEASVYTADGGQSVTIDSSKRIWLAWFELLVLAANNEALFYRGTSVSADSTVNNIIAGGPFSANGGMVASLPWVRFAFGEKAYVKTAVASRYRLIAYGVLEVT